MNKLKRTIYFISFPLSFIGFIFPIYASSIGVNPIQIGYLFSIFSIVSIIIRPFVGSLIDKRGRRTGIALGVILYTLVNLIFILAKDFKYLLIARILQAIASSFLWITVDTFVSDISDNTNRGKNFGIINQSTAKGQVIGSFIGFIILYNSYFENSFKVIFTIFFCTSLIAFYYAIKDVPETVSIKKNMEQGKIKNKKDLLYFLCIMGIISFITSLTAPIYLLYLQENITNNLSLIACLFIPSSILYTFLPQKFGSISDKYGREKTIIIGLLINAILQIFIPFNQKYNNFLILYTLIATVDMFYSPAFSSLIMDFVGENKRGKSYGLYSFASGIGATIGPVVGSYIYEKIGNDIVFYIKGALLIVMVMIICYIYIMKLGLSQRNNIAKIR